MPDEAVVLFEKAGGVASVTLNRPEVVNAFDIRMRDELNLVLEAARDDPDVRAILVRGAGERGFCAGADLTEFGSAPSQTVARQVRWERDLWGLFLSIRKPLVAALHGHVIGSGVEIACLCDIRIAADDALFRMPETALALTPAAGGTQTLPRAVGLGASMKMLLANEVVDARGALGIALAHRVVSRERLYETAMAEAERLASLPSAAVAALKRAVLEGMDVDLPRALRLEARIAARLYAGGLQG